MQRSRLVCHCEFVCLAVCVYQHYVILNIAMVTIASFPGYIIDHSVARDTVPCQQCITYTLKEWHAVPTSGNDELTKRLRYWATIQVQLAWLVFRYFDVRLVVISGNCYSSFIH